MWKLIGICENDPRDLHFFIMKENHKNKFVFPFCHFVVLSNITRDNIDRIEEADSLRKFSSLKKPYFATRCLI